MTESLPSSQKINKVTSVLLFLTFLVLPFQFGKHFWPTFAYVLGQRVDYLTPVIYLSDIFIFLLFILHATPFFQHINKLFWLVLLFLSVSIFFSPSPLAGWYGLLKVVELVFFAWVVAQNKERLFAALFITFGLGIVIEGTLSVLEIMHQGSLNGLWYFLGERSFSASTPGIANATIHGQLFLRPYATFPHPNVLAGYLVLASLFFLVTVLFTTNNTYKIWGSVLFGLGSIILFLTLSRVALIVWFVLLLVALLTRVHKQIWIAMAMLFVPLILFADPVFSGRFLDVSSYTESLRLRELLQQAAFGMIATHPVLGVGLNNFLPQLPYFLQGHVLFGFLQPVHNIYLLVLAEIGILGLVVFLAILVTAFLSSLYQWQQRISPISSFALLAILAIMLIGFTDHYFLTLQQGQLLFALVLGLCFGHGTIPVWRSTKNLLRTHFTKS